MTADDDVDDVFGRRPPGRTKVRARLDAGEVAVVAASHAVTAATADLVGHLGFDGCWLEGEHGDLTWDRIGDLSRAAELWGMTALVRLHRLDPSLVARALALGAHGVVIPQVESGEQAALLASAGRFAPRGARGVSRGRRSYGRADYFATEAADVVLVAQVESTAGLDRLGDILEVDGIDVVFVAPNDLAQSMGHLGQPGHPEVQRALADAISRIAAAGRAPGTLCTEDRIEHFVGLGARFLYTSIDRWIVDGATRMLSAVDATTRRRSGDARG
jgi:4-hydroxy-2-oxoheptanedioate aldolase